MKRKELHDKETSVADTTESVEPKKMQKSRQESGLNNDLKTVEVKEDSLKCSLCSVALKVTVLDPETGGSNFDYEKNRCTVCSKSYCENCFDSIDICQSCLDGCEELVCCDLEKMHCGEYECGNCAYYHHKHCKCETEYYECMKSESESESESD